MKNIMLAENHTFDLFKDYYQNIRDTITQDEQGRYMDPFGQHVRSFKADEFGRLQSVYVRPDYGTDHIILYGAPDGIFHVQGSDFENMYAYIFDHGVLMEQRTSDRSGYRHTKYSANSGNLPVSQVTVHHGGPFIEKRWSNDGKTLIYKKTRAMDKDSLEKTTLEFLTKDGNRCLRIDWRKDQVPMQTELYDLDSDGNTQLKWLCERDHKGRFIFYRPDGNYLRVSNIVAKQDGKIHHIKITTLRDAKGATR